MDRQRLESDLRATLDVLLLTLPPHLVQLDLDQELAKLGPAGPIVQRALGLPRGTLDLRAKGYALCSRIAQLPVEQLRPILELIAWELDGLLWGERVTEPPTYIGPLERRSPTTEEWDAIAALLEELRKPL
jgi:hypothetical protein